MPGRKIYLRFMTRLCFVGLISLVAACSMRNDFGAKLPVPTTFPKLNDVPQRPQDTVSPREQEEMLREMLEVKQNHENDAIETIEAQ